MPFINVTSNVTPGIEDNLGMHARYITCYQATGTVTLRKNKTGEAYIMRAGDKIKMGEYTQGFQVASTVSNDQIVFQYSATDEYLAISPIYENITISGVPVIFPNSVNVTGTVAISGQPINVNVINVSGSPVTTVYSDTINLIGTIRANNTQQISLTVERPFSTLVLGPIASSGNSDGIFVRGAMTTGAQLAPVIFDDQGNIVAVPNRGAGALAVGNPVTVIPSGMFGTFMFDTTGWSLIQLTDLTISGPSTHFELACAATQNDIFNSLTKKERLYSASYDVAAVIPSATNLDVIILPGNARTKVSIKRVVINATGSTPTNSTTSQVFKRTTADTGGTLVNMNIALMDSDLPVNISIPQAFTSLPSAVGTGVSIAQAMSPNQVNYYQIIDLLDGDSNSGLTLNGANEFMGLQILSNAQSPSSYIVNVLWSEK